MKRVVILIDGQNLFYSLKSIGVLEKDINWTAFFNSLLESDDELQRTYWFRPEKIMDGYYTSHNVRHDICKKHYRGQIGQYRTDKSKLGQAILDDIETKSQASDVF